MSEVVELCQSMVRLPSVDPQDRCEFSSPYGEAQMASFVYDWLSEQGLGPDKQEAQPKRESVVVMAEGADSSKTLLLSAHMDTVDVQDMTIEPFAARLENDRIWGRGACDDKGPLAAMMIAFRDRVGRGKLPCNLMLLATCGEEYDMAGAEHFVANFSGKLAGAIFAEPTGLQVVVAHKGVVRLRLETKGKSGHSSKPEDGDNAIYHMARAISEVEGFVEALEQKDSHPLLGHETASVTTVHGGQQINVIPDTCQAQVDWRILPGREGRQCCDELREVLQAKLGDKISVELLRHYRPMQSDVEHPMVGALLDAAEKVGSSRQTASFAGATDASALWDLGIVTLVFGPGNTTQAHTQDEYIETAQLENGLTAYTAFLDGHWRI